MSEVKYDIEADGLVVFKECSSVNEAEIIRSVLESAGIESTINNEYMSMFYPIGIIHPEILIRRADLEGARALIEG